MSSGACGEDGSLWVWGRSRFGQLGVGRPGTVHLVEPTQVASVSGALQLALGWGHAAVIAQAGAIPWADCVVIWDSSQ